MVELRGFEPLTPTLPVWCATSCAIAPYAVRPHHADIVANGSKIYPFRMFSTNLQVGVVSGRYELHHKK